MGISYNQKFPITETTVLPSPTSPNVNNLFLLSNDTPLVPLASGWQQYNSLSSVAQDWGTTTKTYKVASGIFAQNQNFLNANGSLYIGLMNASVDATAETLTTINISNNLVNFKALNGNGAFGYIIDGQPQVDVYNLNFSNCQTLSDVATVIANSLLGLGTATSSNNENIVFESNQQGTSSEISIVSPSSLPAGAVDITLGNYLVIASSSATEGYSQLDATIAVANYPNYSVLTNAEIQFEIVNNQGVVIDTYQVTALDLASYTQTEAGYETGFNTDFAAQNVPITYTATGTGVNTIARFNYNVAGDYAVKIVPFVGGNGTDLAASNMFDYATTTSVYGQASSTGATTVAGTNASGETVQAALSRFNTQATPVPSYASIFTTLIMDFASFTATATAIQNLVTQGNLILFTYVFETLSAQSLATTLRAESNLNNENIRTWIYTLDTMNLLGSVIGAEFSFKATQSNAQNTLASQSFDTKPLNGVAPDPAINDSNFATLQANGFNVFTDLGNSQNAVMLIANDPANGIVPDDAMIGEVSLGLALQDGWAALKQKSNKVPANSQGQAMTLSVANTICQQYVLNGVITAGIWTGSYPAGVDQQEFNNAIAKNGYYTNATVNTTLNQMQVLVAYIYNNSVSTISTQVFSLV